MGYLVDSVRAKEVDEINGHDDKEKAARWNIAGTKSMGQATQKQTQTQAEIYFWVNMATKKQQKRDRRKQQKSKRKG